MRSLLLLSACLLTLPAHAIKKADMGSFKISGSGKTYAVGPNQASFSGTLGPVRPGSGPTGTIPPGHTGSQIGSSGWYVGTAPAGSGSGPTMHMGHGGDVFFAGTKYPFQAGYKVDTGTLLTAAGLFFKTPAGALAFMAAAPLLEQWLNGADVELNSNSADFPDKPFLISGDGQAQWRVNNILQPNWYSSKQAACNAFGPLVVSSYQSYYRTVTLVSTSVKPDGCFWSVDVVEPNGLKGNLTGTPSFVSRAYPAGSKLPSSMDDIAPYMSPRPVPDGMINQMLDAGADIQLGTPVLSGPTQIKGPVTTTQNPDGTTTKTQTTSNFQTSGNKITNVSNVTVTQTCTGDGSCTSTTTTTAPDPDAQPEEEEQDDSANDTPLPDVPKLYERKYPDGIVGIWNTKSQELKQTAIFQFASSIMPMGMTSGSCPSWTLDLDFDVGMGMGIHTVQAPCWIWDVARVIVLVGALILARALVFGG